MGNPRSLLHMAERLVKDVERSKVLYSRASKISRFLAINSQKLLDDHKIPSEDGIDQMTSQIDKRSTTEQNSWSLGLQLDLFDKNEDETKIDFGIRLSGENFEKPFQWMVDHKTYTALSVNDIRKTYKVLVEGPLICRLKIKRSSKWSYTYGFLLTDGVIIFLRLGSKVHIRTVDCRKNDIIVLYDNNLYWNVRFAVSRDQLKFPTWEQFSEWHAALKKYSA